MSKNRPWVNENGNHCTLALSLSEKLIIPQTEFGQIEHPTLKSNEAESTFFLVNFELEYEWMLQWCLLQFSSYYMNMHFF